MDKFQGGQLGMKTSYFLLSQKFLSFKQMVPGIFQIIHGSVPFMTVLFKAARK